MIYENAFADVARPITQLREEMERVVTPLREKIKEAIKAGLADATMMFFERFPEVRTIYWQQYIPTFNDGDPCVFGVSDICFSPVEHQEIDYPHWGDNQDEDERADFSSYNGTTNPDLVKAMNEFESFLNDIEDYLEECYGSNSFVKLHRDGDWHEEYDPPY